MLRRCFQQGRGARVSVSGSEKRSGSAFFRGPGDDLHERAAFRG
jgi:hypothetical protein